MNKQTKLRIVEYILKLSQEFLKEIDNYPAWRRDYLGNTIGMSIKTCIQSVSEIGKINIQLLLSELFTIQMIIRVIHNLKWIKNDKYEKLSEIIANTRIVLKEETQLGD